MIIQDVLSAIGVKITDVVAGLAGGIVNALFFIKSLTPRDVIASILGGSITTAYLAPVVGKTMGTDSQVVGFIIGLTAMAICQQLILMVPGWFKRFQGGPKDV